MTKPGGKEGGIRLEKFVQAVISIGMGGGDDIQRRQSDSGIERMVAPRN